MMDCLVDVHSHILPGIDDGSADLAESLELLRLSARQGVTHMVATPHFYPNHDDPERFLRRREQAEKQLREAAAGQPELPELLVGAEVYFFSGISDSELLSALTIEKKGCILIEMPPSPWETSSFRELEGIYTKQGILPVIAHVDRYIRPLRTCGIPEQLEQLPVLVQANAGFFLNRSTRSMALRMLKKGQIQLLGSDCHNLKERRPNLEPAVQTIVQRLGPEGLDAICDAQQLLLKEANVTL